MAYEYNQGNMQKVLYDVVTLYDCMQNPATLAWLAHHDLPLPGMPPPGQYPRPEAIRVTLENIPGIRVSYLVSNNVWQAVVLSRDDVSWAILTIKNYTGDPEVPHAFSFQAGWDEIIMLVTSHITRSCGPLVLLPDSGKRPKLIF